MKLHSGFNKNQQDYYDEIQAPSTEFHDELLASGIKHHIAFRSFPASKNISNRRSGPVTVFYHRIFLTVIFLFTVSLPGSSSKAWYTGDCHSFASLTFYLFDHYRESWIVVPHLASSNSLISNVIMWNAEAILPASRSRPCYEDHMRPPCYRVHLPRIFVRVSKLL